MPNELIAALQREDWQACKALIHTAPHLLHGRSKSGYTALMLLVKAPLVVTPAQNKQIDMDIAWTDRAAYWKQRQARHQEHMLQLHNELFELMLENGAAATAAMQTNHMTAGDWALKLGRKDWAIRLNDIARDNLDLSCSCALCGEHVERRNQAVKVSERVACGLETNSSVRSFFLDETWAEARQHLMTPFFHALTNRHFPLSKELSESMAIMRLLALHFETSNAQAAHLIDLCCGKSLTSALGALRFPSCVVTAVDLMPSRMLPHYAAAGLNVTHLQLDILAKDFTSKVTNRATEVGLPVIILGVHCCGFLSLAAVEAFKQIDMAELVLLMPCCLPAKRDPRTPPAIYKTRDASTQYLRWCEHLRDALGPEASLDFQADDVLSVKSAVVRASRLLPICDVSN